MSIQIHNIEQGTDDWKEARVGKYTGSSAHKLLTSFGASEYAQARIDSFTGNFHTKRGHVLEEQSIELYEKIYKVKVDRPGFVTNSKYPDCLYSPDGLAPVALIEVKCFDTPQHLKLLAGEIDIKILAQIHFGLLITEREFAHLIAYNPKMKDPKQAFHVQVIKQNRDIKANFKRILTKEQVKV